MGFFDEMQRTIFWQNQEGSASAQDMRRKIALAMLMKKGVAPKTFGEGLFSIGDSLADAFTARDIERKTGEQAIQTDRDIATKIPGATPSAATGPRAEIITPADQQLAEAVDSPAPAASMAAPPPGLAAAVAGFRPPPAYLAPHLAASGLPPERQAYLGHLAGKEARSANEVSPTGAAGPFQFIRSTGRQYGLMGPDGDRRTDPAASIAAVNRLTDDNAAVLEKALGRPPSPGELALAHQQGAGTAAKMLSGRGNAPNYNLAVNNAGGLGPQAAANKIMAYYNMPGSGGGAVASAAPPPGTRDSIAATINAQTPPTAGDTAQESRISDVVGMTRAPPSFGPTASLGGRAGNVQSDAPPVTGALQGPLGASVGDTVQQRQDTLGPPPAPPPVPPAGPGATAQAAPGVFPPVVNAGGQPRAIIPGGGLPPPIAPQIQQAPPDPRSAIRTAPRSPPTEYEPVDRPQPEPPSKPGMGPIEAQLTREILNRDVDPRLKAAAAARIEAERAQLAIPYANAELKYKADIANWQKEQEQNRLYRQTRPKQAADIDQSRASATKTQLESDKLALELGGYPAQLAQERKKREAEVGSAQAKAEQEQEQARIVKRTGMPPDKLYDRLDKEKASVDQTVKAQGAQQLARKAIREGVITGYGANGIVASAKFADWAFKNGMSGNLAANTEIMSATLKSGLSEAIKTVNGEGGTGVSNTDVRIAEGISGSDPGLQLKTIKSIMDRAAEINHKKIDSYEAKIDRYLSGEKAEDFYKIGGGTVPEAKVKMLLENPTDQTKAQFDEVYGPGAANLQISRLKRAQERSGQ